LIVYHSMTGATRWMAEAAATGYMLAAGGYIFAVPENLAALAGLMKDFFYRYRYPVLGRINWRPYGLLICAGSDGANAARQAVRIAAGWPGCAAKRLQPAHTAPIIPPFKNPSVMFYISAIQEDMRTTVAFATPIVPAASKFLRSRRLLHQLCSC
jgi:hypothetical protein